MSKSERMSRLDGPGGVRGGIYRDMCVKFPDFEAKCTPDRLIRKAKEMLPPF